MNMLDEFKTSDFPTAATLLALKHILHVVDRENPHRAIFIFNRTPRLDSDLEKIRAGIKIDPFDFWNAQKRLKSILYDNTSF